MTAPVATVTLRCPNCREEIREAAKEVLDRVLNGRSFPCPSCGQPVEFKGADRINTVDKAREALEQLPPREHGDRD
jgi:predicted RNA-binding Zn-ribbon protein involved in translation (DUF1610 family)